MTFQMMELDDGAASGDGFGGTVPLRELTSDALRAAVIEQRYHGRMNGEVHSRLARACELARAHDLRAEQVIILLKKSWSMLPEAQRMTRTEANEVLSRVVSMCIAEYFTSHPRE